MRFCLTAWVWFSGMGLFLLKRLQGCLPWQAFFVLRDWHSRAARE